MTALSKQHIEKAKTAKMQLSNQIAFLRKDIARLLSYKGCASMNRDYLAAAIKDKRKEIFETKDKLHRYYGYESN